jgi:hypothetical protein
MLPAGAFQFRRRLFLFGPADTEIGHQLPVVGHLKIAGQRVRLEDRDPAGAQTHRACRQPETVDRHHGRIIQHLRHGAAAQTMPLRGAFIGEDGQMHRRFFQAGEF